MPVDSVSLGRVVKSNAGRDQGHFYVIIGFVPPSYVLLADGRERKIAKPKKKNVRHISVLKAIDKGVAAIFASGGKLTDEVVRQAIRTCVYTGE